MFPDTEGIWLTMHAADVSFSIPSGLSTDSIPDTSKFEPLLAGEERGGNALEDEAAESHVLVELVVGV